jgi:hypothetical protein
LRLRNQPTLGTDKSFFRYGQVLMARQGGGPNSSIPWADLPSLLGKVGATTRAIFGQRLDD